MYTPSGPIKTVCKRGAKKLGVIKNFRRVLTSAIGILLGFGWLSIATICYAPMGPHVSWIFDI